MKKTTFLLVPAVILCLLALVPLTRPLIRYQQAEALFRQGQYEKAKAVYETIDNAAAREKSFYCEYLRADEYFDGGEYVRARSLYEGLDNYRHSESKAEICTYMILSGKNEKVEQIFHLLDEEESVQNLLREDDYILASLAMAREEYGQAMELLEELGDFADSRKLLESCRSTVYQTALSDMSTRSFQKAANGFALLGDYEKSGLYGAYCLLRTERDDITDPEHILDGKHFYTDRTDGKVYHYNGAFFYIPKEIKVDTPFLIYFAGGDGQYFLDLDGVLTYLNRFCPKAVCLFTETSGYPEMEEEARKVLWMAEQVAAECGIAVCDPVMIGASNGAYTAMHAVPIFYEEGCLAVKALLTIDTGMSWKYDDRLMSWEEMETAARTGVRFVLFEQRGTGLNVAPIYDLVDSGNDVTAVYCRNADHDHMNRAVFDQGIISWALGELEQLDQEEYEISRLS